MSQNNQPSIIAEKLSQHITERGLTQAAVARNFGISGSQLNQFLQGKYAGDSKKIEAAAEAFLQREKEKRQSPKKEIPFIATSVAKKVLEVARIAHLDGEIGVISGDAGLGKTVAVREYTRRNPGTILIEADLGYTARTLFMELHRIVGLDGKGNLHELFEDIVKALSKSGRMIIIDEAEHLPYRALELLRRVYDKAGVGILLVGMPRLVSNLKGRRSEYAQLYSRVGVACRLDALREADSTAIVHAVIPTANGLSKVYHTKASGNTRVLTKLIMRSLRVAEINGVELSETVIVQSANMLIL